MEEELERKRLEEERRIEILMAEQLKEERRIAEKERRRVAFEKRFAAAADSDSEISSDSNES